MRAFFRHIALLVLFFNPFGLIYGQDLPSGDLEMDSLLIPATVVEQKLDELDSLVNKYAPNQKGTQTDSVENLISKAANAINRQMDSLQSIVDKPLEHSKMLVTRADSLLNGITQKVKMLQDKLNSEAGTKSSSEQSDLNALFDKCDLSYRQKLLRDIPAMDELKTNNFAKNLKNLGIQDDITSKLPDGVDEQMDKLAGTCDLNAYLNNQLRQMGIPGTDDWKKVAKDPAYLDNLIDQKASQFAEAQALKKGVGDLSQVKEVTDQLMSGTPGEMKEEGKKLAIKNATDYMEGHADKLQTAQSQLTKLKKKYSFIGSTSDMKNAKKAKSLEGQPLKKRLMFGGNFNLQRGNPTSLDLSPMIMYKLDKKTYVGISGTFRVKLGVEDKFQNNVTQDVYGYSAIGEYMIKNGFFGYCEFEYLSSPDISQTNKDDKLRDWQEGFLVGVGKQFNFTKGLKGQIIFTYNTLYDKEKTPSNSPWNFKLAIHTRQLSLKGILL